MFLQCLEPTNDIYQGHFGEFSITKSDRVGVIIYRAGLGIAGLSFALGALLFLVIGQAINPIILTGLFWSFCLGLGISLATIHIYMVALHRTLQLFWAAGCLGAVWVIRRSAEPFAIAVYDHPLNLVAIGWVFVALTGLFFKEAFCFNRFEAKFLTALLPILLLGHWIHLLPIPIEQGLLVSNAVLFLIFVSRKWVQAVPPDIGDKSVFVHLQGSH